MMEWQPREWALVRKLVEEAREMARIIDGHGIGPRRYDQTPIDEVEAMLGEAPPPPAGTDDKEAE